jgi:hypothetical protein
VLLPVGLYGVLWAFLWGGLISRFDHGGPVGPRAFARAGVRHLPRFVAISVAAAAAAVLLYLTIHAVLFGPVYEWGAARAGSERNAFFWRVLLYLVFGALLAVVSIVADYARVDSVLTMPPSLVGAVRGAVTFIRARSGAVVAVYLLNGLLLVVLLAMYGLADRRFGGWRGVALGQAYILARLGIRLTSIASEVRLFRSSTPAPPHGASIDRDSPGPPAAT